MDYFLLGDAEIEREIGRRIKGQRLNQNMSQAALADRAGVALKTITNIEAGKGCSLSTLIGVLRGLDMLQQLERFIPVPGLSPNELVKLQGKKRQRATGNRGKKKSTGYRERRPDEDKEAILVREPKAPGWEWGDDDD